MIVDDRGALLTIPDGALGAQLAALKTIFRPSSPIDDRELFRGRTDELSRVIGAVQELGQHAVIYGERGIGKTSLRIWHEIRSGVRRRSRVSLSAYHVVPMTTLRRSGASLSLA